MTASLEEVRIIDSEKTSVAVFIGEHDLTTAKDVEDLLTSLLLTSDLVIADFTQVEFVDSSIMHALYRTHLRAQEEGKRFRLHVNEDCVVKRAFEVSGLLERISWKQT